MKTITLTIPENAKITVDGVEYPTSTEVKLWTPKDGDTYFFNNTVGQIASNTWDGGHQDRASLGAGNIRPTREHIEAIDRKRRNESIIFRYFYERGIDTRWKEGAQWSVHFLKTGALGSMYWGSAHGHPFYVESKAIAEQAIADIPDAIRTVLMGGWV